MIAVLLLALAAQAETGDDVGRGALGGQSAFSTAPAATASPTSAPWWTTFGDPALDELIGRALNHNPDLAARVALEEQSRMNAASAWSGVLPSLSFDSSVSGSPTDALGFSFGGFSGPSTVDVLVGMETLQDIDGDGIPDVAFGPVYETFDIPEEDVSDITWNGSAMLNARWNLDVFGNQVATITASRHATRAAEGDTAATALTVATTVAGAWYDLVLTRPSSHSSRSRWPPTSRCWSSCSSATKRARRQASMCSNSASSWPRPRPCSPLRPTASDAPPTAWLCSLGNSPPPSPTA